MLKYKVTEFEDIVGMSKYELERFETLVLERTALKYPIHFDIHDDIVYIHEDAFDELVLFTQESYIKDEDKLDTKESMRENFPEFKDRLNHYVKLFEVLDQILAHM